MKSNKLYIICGLPFSGKSYISKELQRELGGRIVGRDAIYFDIGGEFMLEETPEEDDDFLWDALWPVAVQSAKNILLTGENVIFDDVCLQRARRDELREMAEKLGVESRLIFLDIPLEVTKERKFANKESKTRHDVPSAWLEADYIEFEPPEKDESPVIKKPEASLEEVLEKIK